jgi:hypothetical protein
VPRESDWQAAAAERDEARASPERLSEPMAPAPATLRASEAHFPPETAAAVDAVLLERGWPDLRPKSKEQALSAWQALPGVAAMPARCEQAPAAKAGADPTA